MHTHRIFFALLFCFLATCFAASDPILLPYREDGAQIDGDFSDPCWQSLPWHTGFTQLRNLQEAEAQTRFKLFHDGKKLFFAIEGSEDQPDKLRQQKYAFASSSIWLNDSIELFICTDPLKRSFYQIIVDLSGQYYDLRHEDNNAGGFKGYSIWDSALESKSAVFADHWQLELALPLGLFEIQGEEWSFNLTRNRNTVKPTQISSFAENTGGSHAKPEIFVPLLPENWQPGFFAFSIDRFEAKYKRLAEGQMQTELFLRVSSKAENLRILKAELMMMTAQGEKLAGKKEQIELQAGKFVEKKLFFENIAPGSYLAECRLYDNLKAKNLLADTRKEISLDYSPFAIKLISPPYRNTIFASMPEQNIEAEINFEDFIGHPFSATLSAGEEIIKRLDFTAAKKTQRLSFAAAHLPPGTYKLEVSSGDALGALTKAERIHKVEPLPGEVWIDKNSITHIDGKRFFPFGWYAHDDADAPKAHLNSVLDTSLFDSPEALLQALDKRQALGEKMLLFPYQEFNANWSWKIFSEKNRGKGLNKEQRQLLLDFIPTIRQHPALLGYYMADEPESRDDNPLWYQEVYELLRELDPWHPCFMLNWGPAGIRRFYKACDILLPDCYPTYYEDGSSGKPRHCSSEWAITASALRPTWFMPLVASWPARNRKGLRGVPPSYDDLRSQFFQALIHNVKGFNLYAYFESQRFSSLILGPDAIGITLQKLQDYLLPNSDPQALVVSTEPQMPFFQAGIKIEGNKQCLIAVNTEMRPVTATFQLKSKNFSDTLYVAGEKRSVRLRNSSFSDSFLPGETHIYVNSEGDADAVPELAATRKAIEDFRAARKKPGNLIGMGEMLVADYLDYSAGKIPPGVPVIRASSDPGSFFTTTKTGSRYYLIDGLRNPKRVEYTWSPASDDKTPFIEIELPAATNLKELRLYTPAGNLKSGSVLIEEQIFPFTEAERIEENEGICTIALPLKGIASQKIRINFEQFKINFHTHNPNKRLLSEIELY
jgi:hypothetical protein